MGRRRLFRDVGLLLTALHTVAGVRLKLSRHQHGSIQREVEGLMGRTKAADSDQGALAEVAWSVSAASRLVPGATCLTQATAGQMLLARRGIASTVQISLPISGDGFRPHAWLIADNKILLGGTAADHARHRRLHDLTTTARSGAAE